jgi:predicted short-subunit dehydrogenase-like oxidoreductase (DUF2520 family)
VATALGVAWRGAGHRIVGASGRDASAERVARHLPAVPFGAASAVVAQSDVVVLGVVDDAIADTCAQVAPSLAAGTWVLHLSGSMGLDTLEAARERGAGVLSLHPLQSFPDVETGIERLPGSGIAVTAHDEAGRDLGMSLALDAGGRPFVLEDSVKPLYHAAAVFCANYLVTVEAVAERLMEEAGVVDAPALLAPLARTAFDRTFDLGPATALTGPAVRGDVGTLDRNLRALRARAPETVPAYVALAGLAADLAARAGRLSEDGRQAVERELSAWR